MGTIRCGDMYMVQLDHPSSLYGWSVSRVWWMPWRYNLHLYYINGMRVNGVNDLDNQVVRRLTKDGLKGTLKIFELLKED